MQNERGWADRRLSMVGGGGWVGGGRGGAPPPPLENEKRKGEYRPISAVGGKYRHEIFPEFRNFYDLRGHSRGNPRSGLIFMGGGGGGGGR